jgi:hypothetical protein
MRTHVFAYCLLYSAAMLPACLFVIQPATTKRRLYNYNTHRLHWCRMVLYDLKTRPGLLFIHNVYIYIYICSAFFSCSPSRRATRYRTH